MPDYFDTDVLSVFLQIVLIDLVLAGDNAIVIGLASAGLPEAQRGKAILIGIAAATILRLLLAGLATQSSRSSASCLLAGSCCCGCVGKCGESCAHPPQGHKVRWGPMEQLQAANLAKHSLKRVGRLSWPTFPCLSTTFWPWQAAREHPIILIFGLGLSIAMMGMAASFIARLLQTHRWIAYVGLAVILYVADEMVFRGTLDVIKVASI